MVARSAKSKQAIRIHCDGMPGPGLSWTITVEFRPLSHGYSVWVYENNAMTAKPKWQKVASCTRPLSWRTAYASLAENEDLRVFGDFWFETVIEGATDWAADILRLVFVVDEESPYNYRNLGDLLVGFTDGELQSAISDSGLNPFQDKSSPGKNTPPAFGKLARLANEAAKAELVGRSLQEIRSELKASPEASLVELGSRLTRRAAKIKLVQDQQLFAEFIDSAKAKHLGPERDGSFQVKARYRACKWETIYGRPLPVAIEKRIDLISMWLAEPEKPLGGSVTYGMGDGSDWPTLMWLLSAKDQSLPSLLEELLRRKPKEAKLLAKEVMRRGKSEAYYFEGPNRFSGWAQNVIGRHVHKAHVDFALKFQSVCDSLEIPIDDKYRIGELPYLPPRKS